MTNAKVRFVLGLLLASTAMPAIAQTDNGELSEIVVTAQRREQSLQEVPLAVSAIGSEALQRSGATETTQLMKLSPSLTMTQQNLSVTPFIRGIGSASGTVGSEGAVATYIDGVYVQSAQAAIFAFNNIERVEVLRGPQGTLFGRNTTGGLIQVVTKDPSHKTALDLGGTVQNYNTVTGQFYGTTGLTENIAGSLAVIGRSQGEGYGHNITVNRDVDFMEYIAGRAELQINPSDGTRINLAIDRQMQSGGLGLNRTPAPGTRYSNGTAAPSDPRETRANIPGWSRLWQWGVALDADVSLTDALAFKSITAYRRNKSHYLYDQDTSAIASVNVDIRQSDETVQQELLVSGDWERLNVTTGVFYLWALGKFYPNRTTSTTTPTGNIERYGNLTTKSYAAYLQGTYALTDATNLTAGVRYTREEKEITGYHLALAGHPLGAGNIVTASSLTRPRTAEYNKPTWRLAIDHELSDEVMVYASLNRGYRSGGFNVTTPTQAQLQPEVLDSYEGGLKSELFNRQLRLNVAGYIYDYTNLQVTRVVLAATTTENAARAKAHGVEFDAEFAPRLDTGRLTVRSTLGYAWGEYSDFPNGPVTVLNPFTAPPAGVTCVTAAGAPITSSTAAGGATTCSADLAGQTLTRMPKFTLTVGAEYAFPLAGGELSLGADYYRSSKFYFDPANRLTQGAYALLSAQVAFEPAGGRYRFRAFGANLTDETYFVQGSEQALGDIISVGTPRTYGVGVDVHF